MEKEKTTTWADLKEFVNSLSDGQLSQQLKVEVVDSAVYDNIGFGVVEEDIYMYDDDVEDIGSLLLLKECHEDDFKESLCEKITDKGSVYICAE